jgi:hypothetical protein
METTAPHATSGYDDNDDDHNDDVQHINGFQQQYVFIDDEHDKHDEFNVVFDNHDSAMRERE